MEPIAVTPKQRVAERAESTREFLARFDVLAEGIAAQIAANHAVPPEFDEGKLTKSVLSDMQKQSAIELSSLWK